MFRKGRGAFPSGFLRTGVTERMLALLPRGLREPCSRHQTPIPSWLAGLERDVHLVKTEEVFLPRSIASHPLVPVQYISSKIRTVRLRQMLGPLHESDASEGQKGGA